MEIKIGDSAIITKVGMTYGKEVILTGDNGYGHTDKFEVKFDNDYVGYYYIDELVSVEEYAKMDEYQLVLTEIANEYEAIKKKYEDHKHMLREKGFVINTNTIYTGRS